MEDKPTYNHDTITKHNLLTDFMSFLQKNHKGVYTQFTLLYKMTACILIT